MSFQIPSKYGNPVCGECHDTTEAKYHACQNPCSHLVSYASHQAQASVVKEARASVQRIRAHPVPD